MMRWVHKHPNLALIVLAMLCVTLVATLVLVSQQVLVGLAITVVTLVIVYCLKTANWY